MKPIIMRWYDTDECLPSVGNLKLIRAMDDKGCILYLYAYYESEWKIQCIPKFDLIPISKITHWADPID